MKKKWGGKRHGAGRKGKVEEAGMPVGARAGGNVEDKPPGDWSTYQSLYDNNWLAHASVETMVAEAVGQGFYTTPPLSGKAENKQLVDNLCDILNLDDWLQRSVRSMAITGNTLSEKIGNGPNLTALKVLPAATMRVQRNPKGPITGYSQVDSSGNVINKWKPEEILHLKFVQTDSSTWGTGLIQAVNVTLSYMTIIHLNMLRFIRRYANNKLIFPVPGTDAHRLAFAAKLVTIQPDEDLILEPLIAKGARELTMDPRARFTDYLQLLISSVQDGVQTPTISLLKNATEASATEMRHHFQNWVAMIQRKLKRTIELEIFQPAIGGIAVEATTPKPTSRLQTPVISPDLPRLEWGMPRTGIENLKPGDILMATPGCLSPLQARQVLRKMGIEVEEEEAETEPEGVAGKVKQKLGFGQKQPPATIPKQQAPPVQKGEQKSLG